MLVCFWFLDNKIIQKLSYRDNRRCNYKKRVVLLKIDEKEVKVNVIDDGVGDTWAAYNLSNNYYIDLRLCL